VGRRILLIASFRFAPFPVDQAGEGSRTLVSSLEGYGSTVELHPRVKNDECGMMNDELATTIGVRLSFIIHHSTLFPVGGEGFEPSKALPSDLQSDPFDRSGNPPSPKGQMTKFQ
jgi:hypothetical protein